MSFAAFSRREWWNDEPDDDDELRDLRERAPIAVSDANRRLINALTLATNADADPEHIPPAVRL